MQRTAHSDVRMNQRGITGDMIELVLEFGEPEGDKTVLTEKACRLTIETLKKLQKKLEHASKKGGLTVVSQGDALITTYRTSSFSMSAKKRIKG